jgi:polar amino acid transport system substrate-binding protein
MKQVSVFCGLVIVLWSIVACQVYADTITLVADEWCPYNCAPESDAPGYMIEIARRVFEPKGHTLDYQILPWARAVQDSRAGKYTAIVGAYKGDAPDFIFPANELGQINQSFFVTTESSWNYTGIESLANIAIGVIKDYAYGDELDAYIGEHGSDPHKVQVVAGIEALTTNIQKLLKGRIVAVLENENVLLYKVSQMGVQDKIRSAGIAVPPEKAYIAFSPAIPQAQEYATILSEGVAQLRQTGELSKILEKYGLQDWK